MNYKLPLNQKYPTTSTLLHPYNTASNSNEFTIDDLFLWYLLLNETITIPERLEVIDVIQKFTVSWRIIVFKALIVILTISSRCIENFQVIADQGNLLCNGLFVWNFVPFNGRMSLFKIPISLKKRKRKKKWTIIYILRPNTYLSTVIII